MSIPLTGTGGLFTRIGLIGGIFNLINTNRGTDIPPKIETLQAQYFSADQETIDGIYTTLSSYQDSLSSTQSQLRTLASNTIVQMVNDSSPQSSKTSLSIALQSLIAQMKTSVASVEACAVAGTITPYGSNTGNAVVYFGYLDNFGHTLENSFQELITATVVQDSQTGGVSAGSESLTFSGQYAVNDTLSNFYPVGSGSSSTIQCVNSSLYQQGGNRNFLYNSDFEIWTIANIPDNFVVSVGVPGTTIFKSTSTFYDGLASLNFLGDGSELTAIYQEFNSLTGSSLSLLPLTQYSFNAFVRVDSTPAAGVLSFSLTDGSNVVTLDDNGVSNTISKSLTSVSTSWVSVSGFFRTPRILPSKFRICIKLSTALTTSRNVYIDRIAFSQPLSLYNGGPVVSVFSGNTNLIKGDYYSISVTNDYVGGFQRLFDKFFNMKSLGLILPSSGSPTISDSLIT